MSLRRISWMHCAKPRVVRGDSVGWRELRCEDPVGCWSPVWLHWTVTAELGSALPSCLQASAMRGRWSSYSMSVLLSLVVLWQTRWVVCPWCVCVVTEKRIRPAPLRLMHGAGRTKAAGATRWLLLGLQAVGRRVQRSTGCGSPANKAPLTWRNRVYMRIYNNTLLFKWWLRALQLQAESAMPDLMDKYVNLMIVCISEKHDM